MSTAPTGIRIDVEELDGIEIPHWIEESSGVEVPEGSKLVPTHRLIPASWNPNVQSEKVFNSLVENIQSTGFNELIVVSPIRGEEMLEEYVRKPGRAEDGEPWYLIVGGKHRHDAAQLLDMKVVPVIVKHTFDHDQSKFQNMRMNMLKGKIDPEKFMKLYEEMSDKYGEETTKEMMGMVEERELQKLIAQTREELPPDLQKKLDEAKDEIKTVDDLSRVLNELFSKHGDTLPYNFMVFTFGGKTHYWVQMDKKVKANVDALADFCFNNKIDLNRVFEELLTSSALDTAKQSALASVDAEATAEIDFSS